MAGFLPMEKFKVITDTFKKLVATLPVGWDNPEHPNWFSIVEGDLIDILQNKSEDLILEQELIDQLIDKLKEYIDKLKEIVKGLKGGFDVLKAILEATIKILEAILEELISGSYPRLNQSIPLFKQKANDGIITSTENIFNGFKQLLSSISFDKGYYLEKKTEIGVANFIDNVFGVEFVYFLCLILAVYCFDTICNSFFDLFKPLVRQRDQNYEIQRLRLSDKFIQIVGFSITFLQLYITKFNGYWNNWAFFSIILHLNDTVYVYLYHWIVIYCYYPTLFQWIAFMGFYYIIVRRFGPDGVSIKPTKSIYNRVRRVKPDSVSIDKSKDSKYDIKITRNIMNVGYELWYKHTVRWNINFAVTLSFVLHSLTFFETNFRYMISLSENTYEVINILITLIWIYGLICVMLGHCAKVPFFNRAQESHLLADR